MESVPEVDDPHPSPNEIEPYVAVGPTPDYSITVHKETFDTGFLVVTFIFGLLLLIIITVTIIAAYNFSKLPPPPPGLPLTPQTLTINTNYGAVPFSAYNVNEKINAPDDGSAFTTKGDCLSAENTQWVDDHCTCIVPFFGHTCSREKYNYRYFAVGVPDETTLGMNVIEEIMSDSKSFNSNGVVNSCSDHCDKNPNCNGFIYHSPGRCTLLSGDVIVPKGQGISYSHNIEPTLYMKSSNNLHFENRIFLAAHPRLIPSRSWLIEHDRGYSQLTKNVIKKINFYPEYVKMYGDYTGIYCLHPFTHDLIPDLLHQGTSDQCYIHKSGSTIDIPPDWRYKNPIYVVYI